MFKQLIQIFYKFRLIIGLVFLILVLLGLILINKNKNPEKINQTESVEKTNSYQSENLSVNQNKEIEDEGINKEMVVIEENKIKGLTRDEILSLGSEEYRTFVNGLSDGEKDLLPGKYDISGYTNSFENDYFKIGLFNSLDMVLGVKIKGNNEEESKQSFEDWFSKNISNKRSDIEVVWINSKT
jgi:hypothetical protein